MEQTHATAGRRTPPRRVAALRPGGFVALAAVAAFAVMVAAACSGGSPTSPPASAPASVAPSSAPETASPSIAESPSSGTSASVAPSESSGSSAAAGSGSTSCIDSGLLGRFLNNLTTLQTSLSDADKAALIAALSTYDFGSDSQAAQWRDTVLPLMRAGNWSEVARQTAGIYAMGNLKLKPCA